MGGTVRRRVPAMSLSPHGGQLNTVAAYSPVHGVPIVDAQQVVAAAPLGDVAVVGVGTGVEVVMAALGDHLVAHPRWWATTFVSHITPGILRRTDFSKNGHLADARSSLPDSLYLL